MVIAPLWNSKFSQQRLRQFVRHFKETWIERQSLPQCSGAVDTMTLLPATVAPHRSTC